METATSVTLAVTPGRQQFHPGHPKCWAMVTVSAGTPTLQTSYNITSITDSATGQLLVTIATDFSSANWACLATAELTATTYAVANDRKVYVRNATRAVGSVALDCIDSTTVTNLKKDPASWFMAGYGDQA
jgi:hypothetical protein